MQFNVPMSHFLLMNVLNSLTNLKENLHDGEPFFWGSFQIEAFIRLFVHVFPQTDAMTFHQDVKGLLSLLIGVVLDDVWVVKGHSIFDFSHEFLLFLVFEQ